jgi:hypothetical protein
MEYIIIYLHVHVFFQKYLKHQNIIFQNFKIKRSGELRLQTYFFMAALRFDDAKVHGKSTAMAAHGQLLLPLS